MQDKYVRGVGAVFLSIVAVILFFRARGDIDDNFVSVSFVGILGLIMLMLWLNQKHKKRISGP